MPTKTIKPKTPLAKSNAEMDRHARKSHRKFDEDAKKHGRETAIFNAGFVKGVAAEAKNARRRATRTRAKKLADAPKKKPVVIASRWNHS
jgi:hypothetical protein